MKKNSAISKKVGETTQHPRGNMVNVVGWIKFNSILEKKGIKLNTKSEVENNIFIHEEKAPEMLSAPP